MKMMYQAIMSFTVMYKFYLLYIGFCLRSLTFLYRHISYLSCSEYSNTWNNTIATLLPVSLF